MSAPQEFARQARYARLRDTDDRPDPPVRRSVTEVWRTENGWRWRCRCGATSWRHQMNEDHARRDLREHTDFGVMHRDRGFYNTRSYR